MIFPLPCLKSNEWHTFNLFPTFPPSWAPKPDCKAFLRALQRVTACKVEQFGNAEARIHDLVWGASGLVVRVQKVRDLRSTFDFESECWAAGRLLSRPLLLRPVFFSGFSELPSIPNHPLSAWEGLVFPASGSIIWVILMVGQQLHQCVDSIPPIWP